MKALVKPGASVLKTQLNKPAYQICRCLKTQENKMPKKESFKNSQIMVAGEPCYIKSQINLLFP